MKIQGILIRILDISGAIVGLSCSIIPVSIIAISVKKDGGPVFFKQERIGKNAKSFMMWKIRSMVTNAEEIRNALIEQSDVDGMFKMKEDPRVTKIGKFIRKHSLDELPQFWNVLKGDMSLVGPRPALREEVENYPKRAMLRLNVKPGITGLWQVNGRSNVDFDTMIDLDLKYIANRSLWGDIVILFKTVLLIFPSEKNGAY
ncbi:Lipopolysaccharide synthesis sugar transferase [Leuconostoc gasicomitatum]|uniref:sugar transferase n=1 Tax=Leuconostoc gelidum group TaxID=3016637 RepID=UPI00027E6A2C|nr:MULTISPECIES: sugar transferase [Leuconostoc gelidum group]AFS40118.1 lipopolysaccharide synthesis sugar transferase [Leuconostoc gelidum JB7]MBZ5952075.1 sugar transferase [Leuconostoc gasicomitatum]MBZ5968242.1 sugar transferase [Leuconostoc gasicomitatum]MBZ5986777.1 sugar transferase [Leuconostoc gelidum subsp. gelidum]QDJ30127.1 UDP-phosphate galactose phosphotransferase [Leuconostoc gelidum subsp. gelidum]